jgi:fatty acid-binding protein DegV
MIGSEGLPAERIHLIDSTMISMGLAVIVMEAVKLRDAGFGAAEITEKINEMKGKSAAFTTIER